MEALADLNRALDALARRWSRLGLWLYPLIPCLYAILALVAARQGDDWAPFAGMLQGALVWSCVDFAELRHRQGDGPVVRLPRWIGYPLVGSGIVLWAIMAFCIRSDIIVPWWFSALAGMVGWWAMGALRLISRPRDADPASGRI